MESTTELVSKMKDRFLAILLSEDAKYNSSLMTKRKYDSIIDDVKRIKTSKKKESSRDYRIIQRYDVLAAQGCEKLIQSSPDGRVSVKRFVHAEELFDILYSTHLLIGHGGRDRMLKQLKVFYANITQAQVKMFLDLCEPCQQKQKSAETRIVDLPIIPSQSNMEFQVDCTNKQEDADMMERQTIKDFIELYRNEPSLWKIRSSHYNNRAVKSAAYRRMVNKLREVHPEASLGLVKRKINALRTNFRKELRKVQSSQERNRITGEAVYVPSLWYYDHFHFIADQENEQHASRQSLALDYEDNFQYDSDDFDEEFEVSSPGSSKASKKSTSIDQPNTSHHLPSFEPVDRQREEYCYKQQEDQWFANGSLSPSDGQESFGRYVGSRLREMDSANRTFAERLISEVLFRGQMAMLTKYTSIKDDAPVTNNEE